jgi:hypothetical protein
LFSQDVFLLGSFVPDTAMAVRYAFRPMGSADALLLRCFPHAGSKTRDDRRRAATPRNRDKQFLTNNSWSFWSRQHSAKYG